MAQERARVGGREGGGRQEGKRVGEARGCEGGRGYRERQEGGGREREVRREVRREAQRGREGGKRREEGEGTWEGGGRQGGEEA